MRNPKVIARLKAPEKYEPDIHVAHIHNQVHIDLPKDWLEKLGYFMVAAGTASSENCLNATSPGAYAGATIDSYRGKFK